MKPSVRRIATATALVVDLVLGEPPTPVHPVVLMGTGIRAGRKRLKAGATPGEALLHGALVVAGGAATSALIGQVADRLAPRSSTVRKGISVGVMLKPTLAVSALLNAAKRVEVALAAGDVVAARRHLARDLVSRETTNLTASDIAEATIESLSENLSDSVVAPLLAFRVLGLAGAYAYRFVNTADAMLGYRTDELEWLGKSAARLDDALNLVPARLTALLIAAASPLGNGRVRRSLGVAWRDHARTPSPNDGWPMAAMAGALDCRLAKRGVYELHPRGRPPRWQEIRSARRIVAGATAIAWAAIG